MSLAFHACPPPGEWLNDPNGLIHADGAWRLFTQHRADAPAFRATGWARLSSANGLDWAWDGPVIATMPGEWAYSGSVGAGPDGLTAVHTVHHAATGLESQVIRTSTDAGLSWSDGRMVIEAARDVRDPFVCGDGTMLLARPCGWDIPDAASQIGIWREGDAGWGEVARIGPWHPPGVMWEVPVVLRTGARDLLLISTVDRRDGAADCTVFGWAGVLGPTGFDCDPDWPTGGRRIDLGPDFYAAMAASDGRVVAWLSSWATARDMPWPGFAGGPISLLRRLSLDGSRVRHEVDPGVVAAFVRRVDAVPVAGCATATIDGHAAFTLSLQGAATATVAGDPAAGTLAVRRSAGAPLAWAAVHDDVLAPCATRRLTLFVDGPAVELFVEPDGCAVSLALPDGGRAFEVQLTVDGASAALDWTIR